MARRSRPNPQARRPAPRPDDGSLRVNGYSARWLAKGFAWIYPAEVVGGPRGLGREVAVTAPDGRVLGRAITDQGWLAARVYRHDDGPLDDAWMGERLRRAIALRRRVVPEGTTAWRVVHGENDALPGLRVDWWDGWVTVVLDSPAVAPLLDLLVRALQEQLAPRGVYLCYRLDPRDDRDIVGLKPTPGWIAGTPSTDEVEVVERGMRLWVRPWEAPDAGAYCDMREVRRWLEPHWAGQRVLNTFAYTGAFSVAALLAGAERAVSVDLSRPNLDRLVRNLQLNGFEASDEDVLAEDTFKALDRFRRTGQRFDVAVLDPPSFSHGPGGTWSFAKDMPRLVASTARVLDPGGWLVAASNHGQTSPKAFRGMVSDGLARAGRPGREIAWLSAAPDFPAAVSNPEGHYLKVGVWALD